MSVVEAHICPVCREQVPDDAECGPQCWHAEYGYVEGVKVQAVVASDVDALVAEAQPRLDEARREREARDVEAKRWRGLTDAEREAEMATWPLEKRALHQVVNSSRAVYDLAGVFYEGKVPDAG